jgi:oligopeptidase A
MSTNPLLFVAGPPRFGEIEPSHVVPAVKQRLEEVERAVEQLTGQDASPTWANFVEPLDVALEALERAWGPVEHLNAVLTSDALREAHREGKPLIAEHAARLSQDERLFKAYQAVLKQADQEGLDAAQRKALSDAIRDFKLAGVDLPPEKKERYRELKVELSQLSSRFSDNLVDADKAFRMVIDDPAEVAGLPESALAAARAKAVEEDPSAPEQRWVFTLHMPSYLPFMQYAKSRARREELYRARASRCTSGEGDNSPLITRILTLRQELAKLLGFETYTHVSLATKMADSPEQVFGFLHELGDKSLAYGKRDIGEVRAYANEKDGLEDLQVWDYTYYREALREERYSFSDEEVRAYFPLDRVLNGLFQTLKRLYGIDMKDVTEAKPFPVWHEHVRSLEVHGPDGELRGHMLLDLFARDGKRQGAWMGDCVERAVRPGQETQHPIAYLVCNFAPPVGDTPSLLRHGEVQTLCSTSAGTPCTTC